MTRPHRFWALLPRPAWQWAKKACPSPRLIRKIPEGKVLKDHESPCLLITPNREQSGYLCGRGPEEGIGDTDRLFQRGSI